MSDREDVAPAQQRWSAVRAVLEDVLDRPREQREAAIDRACARDPELRAEVERLVAASEDAGARVLDCAVPAQLLARADTAPAKIGEFEIVRVLGAGGMGTVYEARQQHPKRAVALKTMRFGFGSPAARARFEYEAEVLGSLQHPGIAQIYAAGRYHDAIGGEEVPFFVMEFVDGARALHAFVAERALDLDATLALFLEVCAAVQYGHERGFLHRDLKPQNVLVDRHGRPKVIDFGIARALRPLDGAEPLTEAGQLLGTLLYMSPEQLVDGPTAHGAASGDAGDVRSDVYALAVMLFELVTGAPPFDLRGLSITAAAARLRDTPPPRPSAGSRGRLPVDLDWILHKALEKDPARRYASVAELAADIERMRRGEPVVAAPPSALYRLQRFARRHRAAVAAALLVAVALVGGTAIAIAGWIDASRSEQDAVRHLGQARSEAARLATINEFYEEVFRAARPKRDGREVRVVDVLDHVAAGLEHSRAHAPEARTTLRSVLGSTYLQLGALGKARAELTRALAVAREHCGATSPEALQARYGLAQLARADQDLDTAVGEFRACIDGFARHYGPSHALTLSARHACGTALYDQGDWEGAEQAFRAVAGASGVDASRLATTAASLSLVLQRRGDLDEAEHWTRVAVESAEQLYGERHYALSPAANNLGTLLVERGNLAEAVRVFRRCVESRVETLGAGHPDTLLSRNNLAGTLGKLERYAEAEAELRVLYDAAGEQEVVVRTVQGINLAMVLEKQDKLQESERLFVALLGEAEKSVGKRHWLYAQLLKGYGVCLTKLSRFELAEKALLRSARVLAQTSTPNAKERHRAAVQGLVALYEAWGRPQDAARYKSQLAER